MIKYKKHIFKIFMFFPGVLIGRGLNKYINRYFDKDKKVEDYTRNEYIILVLIGLLQLFVLSVSVELIKANYVSEGLFSLGLFSTQTLILTKFI